MSVLKVKDEGVWKDIPAIVGEAAGFGTVTATVDTNVGTPTVTVTSSGENTAKNFAFAFQNLGYDDSDLQSDFADLADDFDTLQAQFDTAVAAVTTDTEVTNIRVGDDGVTYTTAGEAVRNQFSNVKSEISDINDEVSDAITTNIPNLIDFDNIVYDSAPSDLSVTRIADTITFRFSGTANFVAFIPVDFSGKRYIDFKFKSAVNKLSASASNISNIRLYSLSKQEIYPFGSLSSEITNFSYRYNNSDELTGAYVRLWVSSNGNSVVNTLTIEGLFASDSNDTASIHKVINPDYIDDRIEETVSPIRSDATMAKDAVQAISEYNYLNLLDFTNITFDAKPSDFQMSVSADGIKMSGTGQIIAWIPVSLVNAKIYYFLIENAKGTVNSTNTNVRLFASKEDQSYAIEILKFENSEYNNVAKRYPSGFNGGYVRIWTQNATNEIELNGFLCVKEEHRNEPHSLAIKPDAIGENTSEAYGIQKYNSPQFIGEDLICSFIRGLDFSEEISTPLTDFKKDGDLMVHVSTFAIINGIVYMTYYANRTHATETPTEHIARFVYCPLNDLSNKTFIDLQSVGDTFNGNTVTAIYDTILLHKDNDVLYLMWTAIVDGVYTRLYRTFTISTSTLSDVAENQFKVGSSTGAFNATNIENFLSDIPHKSLSGDIGIMQRLTSREENGTTYYYTGAYCGEWNAIIKSVDLITWEFVSSPTFENKSLWENTVYVRGDRAYYFLRQKNGQPCGVLTYYDLSEEKWQAPVYVYDCQSRSDLFVRYNVLYLIHAPKDRSHISIMRINEDNLFDSTEIQTARVNNCFYPFEQEYNGELYISYTQNREHIYLSKFSLDTDNTAIMNVFRTLFS